MSSNTGDHAGQAPLNVEGLGDGPEVEPPKVSGLTAAARQLGLFFAFCMACQAIYVSYFGTFEPTFHRSLALLFCVAIIILVFPGAEHYKFSKGSAKPIFWLFDMAMLVVVTLAVYRFISGVDDMENLVAEFSVFDQWIALGAMLVLTELTRRVFGLPLALVAALAIVYALFGEYLPGILTHTGFELQEMVEVVWYGFSGVFGLPTAIVLSLIFIFIIFGSMLQATGAGDSLIKIAFALAGKSRGGPAHAAITASAIFGTMSGSVAANVVGTGAFTIPLIKKRGFPPAFAGAVEAAASTGGQIMPPVMGAAAFLMAELVGIPYLQICVAALLPALFYYGSLFMIVALQASRLGIEPIPESEREKLTKADLINSLMFVIPVFAIIATLIMGRSPAMAGFWATLCAVILGFINPAVRKNPGRLVQGLINGGIAGAKIMMAVGAIGVLLATLDLTGVSLRFAGAINVIGDSNLFLALLVAAAGCLLLGMGMPTLPAYLIIALVLGPAITQLGVPFLAVHLFVFYFGVLSAITPPVAIAAFAAAPIAGANPMYTAVLAVGLALTGFMVPFVFVYNQSLLLVLDFSWTELISVLIRLSVAIWMVATAVAGFQAVVLPWWSRIARLAVALALITVFPAVQVGGLILAVLLTLTARIRPASELA
ncbi:MAG: TRAP transporter fused permease subunit [Burkholderiaceae bacterium]